MDGLKEVKVISRVKKKSKLKKIISILISALILQFFIVVSFIYMGSASDNEIETDYLIILGSGLEGETPSESLAERLKTGLDYLDKYPDTMVVVSGGQGRGEDITEAEAMKRYLVINGVEENRIVMETRATSTMENFKYSRQLIEARTGGHSAEVTFVTNGYHILRSRILAKRNGLVAHALASDNFDGVWKKYFREYLALIKSMIFDW